MLVEIRDYKKWPTLTVHCTYVQEYSILLAGTGITVKTYTYSTRHLPRIATLSQRGKNCRQRNDFRAVFVPYNCKAGRRLADFLPPFSVEIHFPPTPISPTPPCEQKQ